MFNYQVMALILILLFIVTQDASAQTSAEAQWQAHETQVRGYWVDPSTGLMWVGKDNGRDVNWRNAKKYCRDLRLGGYSDWRLGTIKELEGIYDSTASARGGGVAAMHVKGNLFLTGRQWSSTQVLRDDGRPSGLVWILDFWDKYKDKDDGSWFSGRGSGHNRRALCVRVSSK